MIAMVTYTTENVSGLDVSSPVRYRGVPVGRVTDLRVDPRGDHHRNRLRGVPRPPQYHWLECQTDPAALPILEACSRAFGPGSLATR